MNLYILTSSEPSKIQIEQLPLSIESDIALFEITVTDKTGLKVIDEKYPVVVKVGGEAILIGIDNGELDYTGSFKTDTRNTYQGRLLVTVQRTAAVGEMHLTATAPGLSTATFQAK